MSLKPLVSWVDVYCTGTYPSMSWVEKPKPRCTVEIPINRHKTQSNFRGKELLIKTAQMQSEAHFP